MDEIFRGCVDWSEIVREVGRNDWCFVPQALTRSFCWNLNLEVRGLPYRRFNQYQGTVAQDFETYGLAGDFSCLSHASELGLHLGAEIRSYTGRYRALAWWQPNDLAVQRYHGAACGIEPHRDFASDVMLIVSFTVAGSAKVALYGDRHDTTPQNVLETRPGSMLVMAAPLLHNDGIDHRPIHAVLAPIVGPRISMTYRHSMALDHKAADRLANTVAAGGSDDY